MFGQHADGTEDFDRYLDESAPPVPPVPPPLYAWFSCKGKLAAFWRRSKEIKPLVDPQPWNLLVWAKENAELCWDVSHVPKEVSLFINQLDMRKTTCTTVLKRAIPRDYVALKLIASTCLTAVYWLLPGYNEIYVPGPACDTLDEICKPPILKTVWQWDPVEQEFRKAASIGKGVYWFASESVTELRLLYKPVQE